MTSIATDTRLRFASALFTHANTRRAIDEVCRAAMDQLAAPPDLAMLFVSQQHGPDLGSLASVLSDALGTEQLLGCTGESIVGGAREIENEPAISLWLASLPGVSIDPMHLEFQRTPEGGSIVGWPDDLPETWPPGAALLLLGEPFSFPADWLLERLNEDQPGVPVIGGMASGGQSPGENRLFLGRREFESGAVAALVHGPVNIRSIVSQGCRPIGRPYVVTKAERNLLIELGGKPPLEQLRELFATLDERDRQLINRGLHVGRVINEYQDQFHRGDFLVRNVMGADPESGAIALGDYLRPGQTIQFHVRDAQTADEDLRELLASTCPAAADRVAADPATAAKLGALLFTCNGRGTRLFDEPHHDAGVLARHLGHPPLAGFFAQGELGPIGGKNFIHGFTASVVVFSRPESR